MISFSQFNEDVYIYNYLKERNLEVSNFFVEIGAAYPEILSNSRFFTKLGWQALLIDANPEFSKLLTNYYQDNNEVTVVKTLISTNDGVAKYLAMEEGTHSGISDDGVETKSERLSTLLKRLKLQDKKIGILSIDAEGFDNEILKSVLADKIYPEIIIIEANSKADREEVISILSSKYELIGETGRGFRQGQVGMFASKVVSKALHINLFEGVNTIWKLKN